MANDKKNIGPEIEKTETAPAPEQPAPEKAEPIVADPAPAEKAAPVEKAEPTVPAAPEPPKPDKEAKQTATPGKGDPAQAHSGKVVDFAATRNEAAKGKSLAKDTPVPNKGAKKATKTNETDKPRRGRPPKADKDKAPRDKMSQRKKVPTKAAPEPVDAPSPTASEQLSAPRDATRSTEPEQIVYINLTELHPFKNHPFGVRDDSEMKGLVESVKAGGVNQPALVRPREDGGYEIIAGHRRQRASELAGFANMPCIVRNMTDDEAILAMTDDNLRHREKILPMEKAQSLKMQVEAIKHQGGPGLGDDAGKRSTEIVGERNGINYKQVQRYIRLTQLVPELQKMVDEKGLAFTPAVEISFICPKHQKYIAVSIEGQQSSPSLSQAQRLRKLDQEGKLNSDVIDGILCEEKKEVDKVIINSAELERYFGKDKSPREMKDQIMALLDDWKAKQPPELAKPEKKAEKAL